MPKLTLSVDGQVIERAKRYAEDQGTAVSHLVERYLDFLARPPEPIDVAPRLRRLRGALKDSK